MPDPKDYIDDDHVYVRGYVRRKAASYSSSEESGCGFLFILLIAGLVIWFITTHWKFIVIFIGIILAGFLLVFLYIHRSKVEEIAGQITANPILNLKKAFLLLSMLLAFVLMVASLIVYFSSNQQIKNYSHPIFVNNPTLYSNHFTINATPTASTIPNQKYQIIINNNIVKEYFTVSWNKLEIDIHKTKILSSNISEDDFIALKGRPLSTTIYDIKYIHNILYVLASFILFVLFILCWYFFHGLSSENRQI